MVCDRGSDTHRVAMVLIGMVLFWVSRVLLDVLRITTGDGPISGNQLISLPGWGGYCTPSWRGHRSLDA